MATQVKVNVVKITKNVTDKEQQKITERESEKIAYRAKEIAEEMARKELTGKDPKRRLKYPLTAKQNRGSRSYANSFKVVKGKKLGTYVLTNTAKTRDGKRDLGPIIERGSKPHRIVGNKRGFLRWSLAEGGFVFIGSYSRATNNNPRRPGMVRHPGTRSRRISQRAVEQAMREYKSGKLKNYTPKRK